MIGLDEEFELGCVPRFAANCDKLMGLDEEPDFSGLPCSAAN